MRRSRSETAFRGRARRPATAAVAATLVVGLGAMGPGAPQAAAQEEFGRGGVEFQGLGGIFAPRPPSFASDEAGFSVDPAALLAARLGYVFPFQLFVQAEAGYSPVTLVTREGRHHDLNALLYGGTVGYNFQASPRVQAFVLGGASGIRWKFDTSALPNEVDLAWQAGGGVRAFLSREVALRADLRNRLAPDGMSAIRRQLDPNLSEEDSRSLTHNWEATVGFSFFLPTGGARDTDGDGVPDAVDECPGTPSGVEVEARGCALDSDGDGVPDHRDRCPDTPPGVAVDSRGCPVDSDGDGVPDARDRCPDTPAGVQVDARGCPVDSDGDGVPDGLDRCPDTPAGTPVDEEGCPREPEEPEPEAAPEPRADCPEAPPGTPLGPDGCPVTGIERELLVEGRLVMRDVQFDLGSASLRSQSRSALDGVGEIFLRHPGLRIEIQGHTDAIGPADANRRLSLARAESVLRYLTERFPELEPDRFSVVGMGEERPIASNRTEEGRQLNRRVEFVVLDEP